MSAEDRARWDEVYAQREADACAATVPGDFRSWEDQFPTGGNALEIACGTGATAVWLALRGLEVWGLDVSEVALDQARQRATQWQVDGRCRFTAADLDDGLPPGPPVDVIVCHRFRDPALYDAIIDRLRPAGLLAISVLSETGAQSGRYRAASGELGSAFASLKTVASGEDDGIAWLLGRKI